MRRNKNRQASGDVAGRTLSPGRITLSGSVSIRSMEWMVYCRQGCGWIICRNSKVFLAADQPQMGGSSLSRSPRRHFRWTRVWETHSTADGNGCLWDGTKRICCGSTSFSVRCCRLDSKWNMAILGYLAVNYNCGYQYRMRMHVTRQIAVLTILMRPCLQG